MMSITNALVSIGQGAADMLERVGRGVMEDRIVLVVIFGYTMLGIGLLMWVGIFSQIYLSGCV